MMRGSIGAAPPTASGQGGVRTQARSSQPRPAGRQAGPAQLVQGARLPSFQTSNRRHAKPFLRAEGALVPCASVPCGQTPTHALSPAEGGI